MRRFTFNNKWLATSIFAATISPFAHAQVNVLTQHNDIARTGLNASETALNTTNVNAARFGKLFERPVDSNIWAQPLVLTGVSIPNKGTRNVVYVQTEVGQMYAFDADNAKETAPLWRRDLAPSDFSDSLSTPVIDPSRNIIYCVVRHAIRDGDNNALNDNAWFTFHGLDTRTGVERFPAVRIEGSVASNGGKGSVNGRLSFRANTQRQRPALLLLNGVIYAAFGGGVNEYDDSAIWNGWIFGFNAGNGAIQNIWAVSPDRNGGGIWQAANGLASDGTSIYTVTANGGNNPLATSTQNGGRDYGNSIVKLTPNAGASALNVSGFWTPFNFLYMEINDQDLGASGPMLIPGTDLLITGDKLKRAYVLNKNNLGGFANGQNNIVQDFGAWNGHLHGGPVYYNSPKLGPVVYGWPEHDYLKAFKVSGGKLNETPASRTKIQVPPGMPGGMLSVSANGSQNGTGIVWANAPLIGDANTGIVPGVLRAFDANDLRQELWNSEIVSSRDKIGYFAKFASPTVANGKVYAPSFYDPTTGRFQGAKLVVYGLLPRVPAPTGTLTLSASAGLSRVNLSWNSIASATVYQLKRSTSSGGPWTLIGKNLTKTSFVDMDLKPGTRYYYLATADNSGGGIYSNEVSAIPTIPASGSVLSLNLQGGSSANGVPAPLSADQKAGVVPVTNWNNLPNGSGTQNNLRALGGIATSASVSWSGPGNYSNTFAATDANRQLMKGFLSNGDSTPSRVTISNLPSNFTQNGYDVYVYADGYNPDSTRRAIYTVNGVARKLADSQGRDFEGEFFTDGIDDVANYLVFPNLNASSLTITGENDASTDSVRRAPLNAVQIVARQPGVVPSTTAPSVPTGLVATGGNNFVDVKWNAVAGGDAAYTLQRATASSGPYTTIAKNYALTSRRDSDARNGNTYFYRVAAQNSAGSSAFSAPVSVTLSTSATVTLTAKARNALVALVWGDTGSATSYTIERAIGSGAFSSVQTGYTGTAWTDNFATNGQTYRYRITPIRASGAGTPSNIATATPSATLAGSVLSIDFAPTGIANLAAGDVAGAPELARNNWNNARGLTGSLSALKNATGASTSASVSWSAPGSTVLDWVASTPANALVMRAALGKSASQSAAFTITVNNLPSEFVQNGYTVYLYSDSANGTAARRSTFALAVQPRPANGSTPATPAFTQTVPMTDPANSDWDGTFRYGGYSNGNYFRYNELSGPGFTLTMTPDPASGTNVSAAVSAIQIVANAQGATPASVQNASAPSS